MFFWVLVPFWPPNSAKLCLGQPHYSGLRGKKPAIFPPDLKWVQTTAKPFYIEIEIEKSRFLIEKFRPQITPKSALAYKGPWAVQGSGGAHWCPSKWPTVSKKSKKKCAGTASSRDFCEEKSETVTKHRVTRSKITLFRLAIPKMAGVWKKKWNFRVFGGFGGFRPPNSAKLFWGQPHYRRPKGKKKSSKKNRPPVGPNLRHIFFFETVGHLEGHQCAPLLPCAAQGPRQARADFGVIWGRIVFDQKSTFFNFDFDEKWFGGGLDPLAAENK